MQRLDAPSLDRDYQDRQLYIRWNSCAYQKSVIEIGIRQQDTTSKTSFPLSYIHSAGHIFQLNLFLNQTVYQLRHIISLTYQNMPVDYRSLALNAAGLAGCFGFVFGIQKLVPTGDMAWYRKVRKPSWNPPNWLFPVMWIPLKTMQSIGLWHVLREAQSHPRDVAIAGKPPPNPNPSAQPRPRLVSLFSG